MKNLIIEENKFERIWAMVASLGLFKWVKADIIRFVCNRTVTLK